MLRFGALILAITALSAPGVWAQDAIPAETATSAVTETATEIAKDMAVDAAANVATDTVSSSTSQAGPVTTPIAMPDPISTTPAFTLQDALASGERAVSASPVQEKCISIMNGFPDNGHETRYQFFKLTQAMAQDVDPMFRSAIDFYGDSNVTPATPILEVIENIANPVYRQAAPEITIGNMGYLVDFALDCDSYLNGQIESLEAFDQNLTQSDFEVVIGEDALFMRQILSDSMFRLGAQDHEVFGPSVSAYAGNMVRARNTIEYASFESQLENLEAVYMTDLDGRLARSNDVINNEIDREALAHALEITNDLNEQAKLEAKRKQFEILSRILGGR